MAKEIFHVARGDGRYRYGLRETRSPSGGVTVQPHTNDPMGSGMSIDEAVYLAMGVQKDHHPEKTITLDFNGSQIPISPATELRATVEGYNRRQYPKKPPSAHL